MKYLLLIIFVFLAAFATAQQTDYVDFKSAKVDIVNIDTTNKWIGGKVVYRFDILKQVDSIYLDAKNIYDYVIFVNNKEVEYYADQKKLWIIDQFKPSNNNELSISFNAKPKKAIYFVGWNNEAPNQIWTQGQGKYTSNWLPSIDDMNDKIEFDISVTFDKNYEVIANGKLINKELVNDSQIKWQYDMQEPMSSYLVALVIGEYRKNIEYSKSGIPLEMYYYPKDSLKFEPTYRYTKRMFDFMEEEIGVPYPWQNYKQAPVHDFLYAGMENTSLTIFADTFVTDSIGFVDRNYVNVNAHELAHQWFGDLVTETSGIHHWLHEGFATYYALLAEKEVFGDDYYYWRLYEYAQELLDQDKAGGSTSLLDPKSSSTTFYKKGAWALHMLREQVGDNSFNLALKTYLKKHEFGNVTTEDFLNIVEKESGEDLKMFRKKWMESKILPYEEMETYLYLTSTLIKGYLQVDCMNKARCKDVFSSASNIYIQRKAIEQLSHKLPKEAFASKDIRVRQAIALKMVKIPSELKAVYESLLNDESYVTIEAALYNLWNNFPEDRVKYLEQTKDVTGFADKNVRLLWLALRLVTPDYKAASEEEAYKELLNYSSDNYSFEVREKAFRYLSMIRACNEDCKTHLKQATTHHNWRLQKYAKELLGEN